MCRVIFDQLAFFSSLFFFLFLSFPPLNRSCEAFFGEGRGRGHKKAGGRSYIITYQQFNLPFFFFLPLPKTNFHFSSKMLSPGSLAKNFLSKKRKEIQKKFFI